MIAITGNVKATTKLRGALKSASPVNGALSVTARISAADVRATTHTETVTADTPQAAFSVGGNLAAVPGGVGIDIYTGETEVTPTDQEQQLDTSGKKMGDDITVKPIPYAEVSNHSGGITVTIGGV